MNIFMLNGTETGCVYVSPRKHQPVHDSKIHLKAEIPFCFSCKTSHREADWISGRDLVDLELR